MHCECTTYNTTLQIHQPLSFFVMYSFFKNWVIIFVISCVAVPSCDFESPCLWTLSNSSRSDWLLVSPQQPQSTKAGMMPATDISEGRSDGKSAETHRGAAKSVCSDTQCSSFFCQICLEESLSYCVKTLLLTWHFLSLCASYIQIYPNPEFVIMLKH